MTRKRRKNRPLIGATEPPPPERPPLIERVIDIVEKRLVEPPPDPDFHTMKDGETLRDVALQTGVEERYLRSYNGLTESTPLPTGTVIKLSAWT